MKTIASFYLIAGIVILIVLNGCLSRNTEAGTKVGETFPSLELSPTMTATPLPVKTPVQTTIPAITDEPDCISLGGQVEQASIPSKQMKGDLKFHIYLPPCYGQDITQRYPVLYLIHGQSFTDDQWARLGAPQAADELITEGMPPFIIIMPFDKYHYRQPATDPFDEAMIEELIPYIDATYRTIPERTSRAVGGLSRGGGWALHFVLNHPELFGAFGGHSLAILDEDGRRISRLLDAIPVENMPRIFMDIGKSDGLKASVEKFEAQLTERGIPHEWYVYPGYHTEEYWTKHVEEYIKWYAAGWAGE